eukprot:scaffold13360_cov25-Prasinocladus_malaysianus.AAC.1
MPHSSSQGSYCAPYCIGAAGVRWSDCGTFISVARLGLTLWLPVGAVGSELSLRNHPNTFNELIYFRCRGVQACV